MRTLLIVALLLSGCTLADPGDAVCVGERPAADCQIDGVGAELVTDGAAWAANAACGDLLFIARWEIDAAGEIRVAAQPSARTLEDLGGPSYCTPEGVPLCADGSAPVCVWSVVPDQDWLGTCRALMLEAGVTEADCTFPLALWPETTIDPSLIRIENAS